MDPEARRRAYLADITYATGTELGFDHLHDNMAPSWDVVVQRGHNFVVVDEIDSVLIDEARTPLIISGPRIGLRRVRVIRGTRRGAGGRPPPRARSQAQYGCVA